MKGIRGCYVGEGTGQELRTHSKMGNERSRMVDQERFHDY